MDVESAVAEHDECDEVADVVEAVGHADGDLDPVVEGLEPGVGVAQPDRAQDVGPAARIFLESSTISGMRLWDAQNAQRFNSALACSKGCLRRVLNSSLSCHAR